MIMITTQMNQQLTFGADEIVSAEYSDESGTIDADFAAKMLRAGDIVIIGDVPHVIATITTLPIADIAQHATSNWYNAIATYGRKAVLDALEATKKETR